MESDPWQDWDAFLVPAIMSAREDPLGYIARVSADPNDWTGDLIDAVRQEYSFTGWVTSGTVARHRWGKPNCHLRRRMAREDREWLQAQWDILVTNEVMFSDPEWA